MQFRAVLRAPASAGFPSDTAGSPKMGSSRASAANRSRVSLSGWREAASAASSRHVTSSGCLRKTTTPISNSIVSCAAAGTKAYGSANPSSAAMARPGHYGCHTSAGSAARGRDIAGKLREPHLQRHSIERIRRGLRQPCLAPIHTQRHRPARSVSSRARCGSDDRARVLLHQETHRRANHPAQRDAR